MRLIPTFSKFVAVEFFFFLFFPFFPLTLHRAVIKPWWWLLQQGACSAHILCNEYFKPDGDWRVHFHLGGWGFLACIMTLSFDVEAFWDVCLATFLDKTPWLVFYEKLDTGAYRYYWLSSPSSCDSGSFIAGMLFTAALKGVKEVQDIFSGNVYTSKVSVLNMLDQLWYVRTIKIQSNREFSSELYW